MKTKKRINVLRVNVGQRPTVEEIDNRLDDMQAIVSGYIECLPLPGGIDLWLNEEGALIPLPVNFLVPAVAPMPPPDCSFIVYASPGLARPGERGVHIIHGDVFFARHDDEGETISLTDADIKMLMQTFAERA